MGVACVTLSGHCSSSSSVYIMLPTLIPPQLHPPSLAVAEPGLVLDPTLKTVGQASKTVDSWTGKADTPSLAVRVPLPLALAMAANLEVTGEQIGHVNSNSNSSAANLQVQIFAPACTAVHPHCSSLSLIPPPPIIVPSSPTPRHRLMLKNSRKDVAYSSGSYRRSKRIFVQIVVVLILRMTLRNSGKDYR